MSGTLTWMTRQICEFETNIVSVERLKEYSELDTEVLFVDRVLHIGPLVGLVV